MRLANRLIPRIDWRTLPLPWLAAVFVAVAFVIGIAGPVTLVVLAAITFRNRPASALALLSALMMVVLKQSGHWYLSHRVAPALGGVAAAVVGILSTPHATFAWFRMLSNRQWAMFGIAMPVYVMHCFGNGSLFSGDTKPVVPTVVQMLQHGNRDLSAWCNDGRWKTYLVDGVPYFLRRCEGLPGLYSTYPAGMEVFALPAASVFAITGIEVTGSRINTAERVSSRLVTALTLSLFFLLATHFATRETAWATTMLLALGSAFTSTTHSELWQQGGVAFWMLLAMHCEVTGRHRWLQAIACAGMLSCRPTAVSFLIPFGLWKLWHDPRGGIILVLRSLVAYVPWAVLYLGHYGTPFGPSMRFMNDTWSAAGHLDGVLFCPARGLFVYQPWLILLLVPFAFTSWRVLWGSVFAVHTLLIASWPVWWGGHCYGSRLMTEAVLVGGLLVLPAVERLRQTTRGQWLLGGLIAVSLLVHAPMAFGRAAAWNGTPTALDQNRDRLWDWSDPPMLYNLRP